MASDGLLECALAAAGEAVAVHQRHAGRVDATAWTEKGTADFVTHVDREAEAGIVKRIRDAFPDHAILAEEDATAGQDSSWVAPAAAKGWTWIVDPLDGTTNFLHGYPMYGVSIAASCDGRLEVGVVQNSVTGEVWQATRGGGAWRNGERILVSAVRDPRRALIGTGFPFKALHMLPAYLRQFDRVIRHTAGVRRAGSAALDLCHVASGYFDGFWEVSLQPWDIAAGALIVREAGGIITTMEGSEDVVATGSVLAGNPAIHDVLAALLRAQNNGED
jgi:myo-inositol-1(or 4)-monophosphatase